MKEIDIIRLFKDKNNAKISFSMQSQTFYSLKIIINMKFYLPSSLKSSKHNLILYRKFIL